MDTDTRTQIILAAIAAAGPAGDDQADWNARVTDAAATITAMCNDKSQIAKVIDGVANSKVFAATVVKVDKEQSSTRGLVTLRTRPSERHPDGIEQARTERTDNPMGLAMARRLRSLVGHRVLLHIEVEEVPGRDFKVRVIRHVQDLGVEAEAEAS